MLSTAIALIQLLNIVFGYLDAAAKKKAAEALVNAENLKADLKAIANANAARDAVVIDLRDHPDRVRVAGDPDSRT